MEDKEKLNKLTAEDILNIIDEKILESKEKIKSLNRSIKIAKENLAEGLKKDAVYANPNDIPQDVYENLNIYKNFTSQGDILYKAVRDLTAKKGENRWIDESEVAIVEEKIAKFKKEVAILEEKIAKLKKEKEKLLKK